MKIIRLIVISLSVPLAFCATAFAQQKDKADTIYFGGHIVTINDAQPTAEALAVKDGKILAIGARAGGQVAGEGVLRGRLRQVPWREHVPGDETGLDIARRDGNSCKELMNKKVESI